MAPAASAAETYDAGNGYYVGSVKDADIPVEDGTPDASELRSIQPRIVGGQPIDISQVPWQTALVLNPALVPPGATTKDRQFCGGSLVAPNMVITAAHCVFNREGTALELFPGDFNVITGRTVLTSSQGQELPVNDILVFLDAQGQPAYNAQNSGFDVALLQLGANSTTGGFIQIPGPGEEPVWEPGRRVLVSGWGTTRSQGESSDQLLATEVYMAEDGICDSVYSGNFTETSSCAGVVAGGRDSCQGDSGGPLVAPTAQGGVRLVGDVQSGIGCAEAFTPGIYGRFGADPLQTGLTNTIGARTGVNVLGSGGTAPTDITIPQAENLTLGHALQQCRRGCTDISAKRCQPSGSGVQCQGVVKSKRRGKRKTCTENLLYAADTGTITETRIGKRKCKTKR